MGLPRHAPTDSLARADEAASMTLTIKLFATQRCRMVLATNGVSQPDTHRLRAGVDEVSLSLLSPVCGG